MSVGFSASFSRQVAGLDRDSDFQRSAQWELAGLLDRGLALSDVSDNGTEKSDDFRHHYS